MPLGRPSACLSLETIRICGAPSRLNCIIRCTCSLAKRGLKVRRPQNTFGTPDHYVPTISRDPADAATPEIRRMVEAYPASMKQHGIPHVLLGDERQGIVHIIGPELGITQPGMILV